MRAALHYVSLSASKQRYYDRSNLKRHEPSEMSPNPPSIAPLLAHAAADREIADAIARIQYDSVVVHIQDGVVVQIESTEKRRFRAPAAATAATALSTIASR